MKIYTNNQWRAFLYRNEVPQKILENDFDFLDEEILDGFLKYRGCYYHLENFMRISENAPFDKKWSGYCSDLFFSGVLIRISEDGEQYQIATYIS